MEINEKHAAIIVRHAFDSKDDFERIDLVSGIDGQRIPIHPIVLSATSKYFAVLLRPTDLNEKPQEFVLAYVDGEAIKTVVDYCYNGNIVLTEKNLAKCLKIATECEMESLAAKCREYYASILSIESAIEVLVEANKYNLDELRRRASELIGLQPDKLMVTDVLQMDHSLMALLLEKGRTSDSLVKRLMDWFEHDAVGRAEHMPKMLSSIKMEQLTMEFLNETIQPIFDRFKCHKLLLNEYKRRALSTAQAAAPMANPLRAIKRPNEDRDPENTTIFCVRIEENPNDATKIIVEKFDDTSNQLIPQRTFAPINARSFGTALYENKLFVIGGQWNGKDLNSVNAYDLNTGAVEKLSAMAQSRYNFTSIVMEKFIYVFGNQCRASYYSGLSCERYDTEFKSWENIASLSESRHSASAAILNGLIYIFGGFGRSSWANLVETYDPKTNKMNKLFSLAATASLIRPPIQAFDGFMYDFSDGREIREYDPDFKNFRWMRPDIDHDIQCILEANGRLFTITSNGAYGYVTIDIPEKIFTKDYRGVKEIPENLSPASTYYIKLHQCRTAKRKFMR